MGSRIGDVVRESWSGIAGTVVGVDDQAAEVLYASGRRLRCQPGCLVPAPVGPRKRG